MTPAYHTHEDNLAFIAYIRAFVQEHPQIHERIVFVPEDVYNSVKRLWPPELTYAPVTGEVRIDDVLWFAHDAITPTPNEAGSYKVPFALYFHKHDDRLTLSWVLNRPPFLETA